MNFNDEKSSLRKHPLIHLLIRSRGNPKILLLIEPLWGIPFHLLAPFVALYMSLQGITDTQIGILLSVAMVGQMFFSFIGGIITDKLGRKNTTVITDFLGWGVACLVWAISTNFWLFLIAVLLNTADRLAMSSWHCLLVEDADHKDMLGIFTWTNIGGLVAVFFAPIAGILIYNFTVIPVVRGLYVFFSICLFLKGTITYFYCTETKHGKVRREETKSLSSIVLAGEYKGLMLEVLKNPATMKIMIFNVIMHITILIGNTFFGLYVTKKLGVPESYLSFFPILNAIMMLLFMFVIQHKLERVRNKIPLWAGLVIFSFCSVMLILIPEGNLLLIIAYLLLLAVANGLVLPRREAMMQLAIDPKERSRIMAIIATLTVAFAAPFGFLAGYLSDLDRRLPFLLTTVLFFIAIVIVGLMRESEYRGKSMDED